MLDNKKDDIFLSRWINDELSPEELANFQSHPDYEYYRKIKIHADALDLTEYNISGALKNIKLKQINTPPKKTKTIIKLWPYAAIAASIAIIFGIFLFNSDDSFATNYGEQMAVTLPDGSEMILNAKSKASFNNKNWDTNRTISLTGEAYFKVKKGNTFTVTTTNGSVSVLGTEFNVQSQHSFFEAVCYEGKVSVTSDKDTAILTAGKAYRNITNIAPKHWVLNEQHPSWIDNTSSFKSIPLLYVINELQDQYNITIDTKGLDTNTIYTGTFPNNDIDVALKTVFNTLGIRYKLSQDGNTVTIEK